MASLDLLLESGSPSQFYTDKKGPVLLQHRTYTLYTKVCEHCSETSLASTENWHFKNVNIFSLTEFGTNGSVWADRETLRTFIGGYFQTVLGPLFPLHRGCRSSSYTRQLLIFQIMISSSPNARDTFPTAFKTHTSRQKIFFTLKSPL